MVDMCLGNKFCVFEDYVVFYIDLSGLKVEVQVVLELVMSDEIVLLEGKVFFLYFGELVLVIMYELVILLDNIVGWLDGCFLLV